SLRVSEAGQVPDLGSGKKERAHPYWRVRRACKFWREECRLAATRLPESIGRPIATHNSTCTGVLSEPEIHLIGCSARSRCFTLSRRSSGSRRTVCKFSAKRG